MTIIGTIREIKNNENRVGIIPEGVVVLVAKGHRVLVQETAGLNSGYSDQDYLDAGAEIVRDPSDVVSKVDILVKVKEPLEEEYYLLDLLKDKTLFTYLHLSGVPKSLTRRLLDNNITAIAYETVEDERGRLPLLAPMSEVAGVLAVQYGAHYLQKKYGGFGITMGMITGTELCHTVVIGGGVAGEFAARTALGMGGKVTLFEIREDRIAELYATFKTFLGENLLRNLEILKPEEPVYTEKIKTAHVLIGAVLVKGARAPQVVTESQVRTMIDGAVIVDISIDQGGCIWGSKVMTHENPIYKWRNKIFCAVANMPGQVARQSTQALTAATTPYLLQLADKGVIEALIASIKSDGRFVKGLNVYKGKITYQSVAKDLDLEESYADPKGLLEIF